MRAVERIFSVFDAFDADHTKLTLQEISERIGLSKATTFRLVNSLDKKGYLVRLEDQRYCLSMKILRLAGVVASGLNVRDIAHPIIVELAQERSEEHTSELQSLMRISYAVFCLTKKTKQK